jgi:excisionase family DNA binding protein
MRDPTIENREIVRQYYSVKEAALILGVSIKTVYKAIQRRDLPAKKIAGTLRIPHLAVDPARGSLGCSGTGVSSLEG